MTEKRTPKRERLLCGVVQRQMQKSLKRAKTTSQEILLQIFQSHSSEVLLLYEQFLKELGFLKDLPDEKKD